MAGVLVFAGIAWADKEKIQLQLKPDAQAAARAILLKRADLGTAPGWTGGMDKPDYSSEMPCSNFHPMQSDLVLNGSASNSWSNPAGLQITSQAQVLATPAMVALDSATDGSRPARASVPAHGTRQAGCRRRPSSSSFKRIAFPRLSPHSAAFRATRRCEGTDGRPCG